MTFVDGGASSPATATPTTICLSFLRKLWPQIVQGSDFCSGKWDFTAQKSAPAPDVHAVGRDFYARGLRPSRALPGVLTCWDAREIPSRLSFLAEPFTLAASQRSLRAEKIRNLGRVFYRLHEVSTVSGMKSKTCGAGRAAGAPSRPFKTFSTPSILPPFSARCARTSPSCRRAGAGPVCARPRSGSSRPAWPEAGARAQSGTRSAPRARRRPSRRPRP